MKKVNLITKAKADEIAKTYFENSKVPSLSVTRDGQIFLKGSEGFMKMHERDCKLEPSWPYSRTGEVKAIPEKEPKSKEKKKNINSLSFNALRELAIDLTKKGTIKEDEWKSLDYPSLKKFLKDKV